MVGQILGGGKTSRLYERLVYREQIADSASAGHDAARDRGAVHHLRRRQEGRARRRASRQALAEELQRFIAKGPTRRGTRARPHDGARGFPARPRADRRLRRQGRRARGLRGLRGRSRLLPAFVRGDRRRDAEAVARCRAALALRRRLHARGARGPAPTSRPPASAVDRSKGVPGTASFPDVVFPDLQHAKLRNGLPVVIANRPGVPVVRVSLLFDAGYVADQGRKLGTVELHHGHARRRHARARVAADRRSRGVGSAPSSARARSLDSSSVVAFRAEGAPRPVARAVRRRGAQPVVPAQGDRARAQGVDRGHRAREAEPGRARDARCCRRCCTARAIPTPFRSRAPARKRRSRRSTATTCSRSTATGCVPTTQRLIVDGRRRAGRDPAAAREVLRRLDGARHAAPGEIAAGGQQPVRAARVPDRQAGCRSRPTSSPGS